MDFHQREVWVFSVDTHDRLLLAMPHLDPTQCQKAREIVEQNCRLKQQIEDALSLAGFLTPKGVLKFDLTSAAKS